MPATRSMPSSPPRLPPSAPSRISTTRGAATRPSSIRCWSGCGERSRDILSARQLPYVVIDQPARLTTHWAAATPQFARAFGGCILGFLDAAALADGARCDGDRLWAGTPAIKTAQPSTASHPGDKAGGG